MDSKHSATEQHRHGIAWRHGIRRPQRTRLLLYCSVIVPPASYFLPQGKSKGGFSCLLRGGGGGGWLPCTQQRYVSGIIYITTESCRVMQLGGKFKNKEQQQSQLAVLLYILTLQLLLVLFVVAQQLIDKIT